jgi:flagellar M-ring protein FliF
VQAAGGIKRIAAAVTVAARWEGTGADRKVVNRTPEEIEKLRRVVSNAIGVDATRGDTISLEELAFNDQFAVGVTQELEKQQTHDFWFNLARNASYPALGVLALLILLRLFKTTPVQDIPIGVPVGRLNGRLNGKSNGVGHAGDWADDAEPRTVTVDVLNKLIKDNPANMTQAIRDWMGKGGRAAEQ